MIVTKKIKLLVSGNYEEKSNSWNLLKYYENTIPKLNNFIVTELLLNDLLQEKIIGHNDAFNNKLSQLKIDLKKKIAEQNIYFLNNHLKDEVIEENILNLKKVINDLISKEKSNIRELFKNAFNKTLSGSLNERIRQQNDFKTLPDTIISPAINELKYYSNKLYKFKNGEERIKFFTQGIPFNSRGRDLKFYENDGKFYINWVKNITFQMILGKDKSNNINTINKIISKEIKPLDSKIQIKNNEIFLLLAININQKNNFLINENILGVSFGRDFPLYLSTNTNNKPFTIGDPLNFKRLKLVLEKQKTSILNSLNFIKGGKGKNKKFSALEKVKNKEKNFVKNYNHYLSAEIIKYSISLNCKQINIEDFKNNQSNIRKSFFLQEWNYYQFYELLEYKCKLNNIIINYVDSSHIKSLCFSCKNTINYLNHTSYICEHCFKENNYDFNKVNNIIAILK